MRGLIYDVVTGMAIIAGLFIVTMVMRANQNFIMGQSETKTEDEQAYLAEIADREETYYRVTDVYGTFHTLLKNGNITEDAGKWAVTDYTIITLVGTGTIKWNDYSTDRILDIENKLIDAINAKPNGKCLVSRSAEYDDTLKHSITTYTFEIK